MVQGGIDGYSRMVVYLSCSTNNKAETTWECFQKATKEFGVPSRIRSDKGGENQLVCYFMVFSTQSKDREVVAGCVSMCAPPFMRCFILWKHRRC